MILSLVFLVAAFIIFFQLIEPTYGDLETLKGQELESRNLLANEQNVVGAVKKLLGQYESEGDAANGLALAMPSGPNVASAVAQIYGIATNSSIAIQSMTLSTPSVLLRSQSGDAAQVVRPAGTFSIQISSTGSYEDLKNFLSQLETNIRIFDVTGFSLQPAAKGDLFNYTFTVATYYQML